MRHTMRRSTTVGRHSDNGRRIFDSRRDRKLTQMQVCALAGVSHRQYVRLENGEHLPSGDLRDRLAEVFGVPRESIKSADDDEESPLAAASTDDLVRALVQRVVQT